MATERRDLAIDSMGERKECILERGTYVGRKIDGE